MPRATDVASGMPVDSLVWIHRTTDWTLEFTFPVKSLNFTHMNDDEWLLKSLSGDHFLRVEFRGNGLVFFFLFCFYPRKNCSGSLSGV